MAGPDWGDLTPEEREALREQRALELEEKRARRAPKRERRAEIREVSEQFAAADDADDPFPDEMEDDNEDAALLQETEIPGIAEIPYADEPQIDRNTLLAGLDPKTRALLTDEDINEILAEERRRADDEQKKAARASARETIRHRMRVERGLLDAETLRTREQNERLRSMVRIRFDLPGDGAGHKESNGIRLDGRLFAVRQWHTLTVAELETLREIHYNAWVAETQFKTLDQASRFGITTMNRLQGTTPAKAIFAQQPNQIEVQNVE